MTKQSQPFPYRDYQHDAVHVHEVLQRSKLWLYLVLSAILLTPCIASWLYLNQAKITLTELHAETSIQLASSLMQTVDTNMHANLPATGSENEAYTDMYENLQAFIASDPRLLIVRTMLLIGEDIHVIVDSSEQYSFMQTFAPQSMAQLQITKAIKLNQNWYENIDPPEQFQANACTSFPAARSNYPGMLCLTLSTEAVNKELDTLTQQYVLITLVTLLISIAIVASIIQHRKQFLLSLELIQKQRDLFLKSSLTDPLTGALNRRAFHLAYASAQSQLQRNDLQFAILGLDIDNFKDINDKYGHDRGDEVLTTLVKNLHDTLRSSDHLARIGGEEFCIICNIPDLPSAIRMAEKILQTIREIKISTSSLGDITFTSSLGIYIPTRGETMKNALKYADIALYEAKKAGRNQVCVYKEPT